MKKIGNSFAAIPIGLLLILVGIFLLGWNEGNNVKNIKTTDEASKSVIDVKSDSIDTANDGKLIATNGQLDLLGAKVSDFDFNVTLETARLERIVEMYQWDEETSTDSDGNEVTTYRKIWSDNLISSSSFEAGHDNPASMPYESMEYTADNAKIGAFDLTDDLIDQLEADQTFAITPDVAIPTGYKATNDNYITNSTGSPQIGDVRIKFQYNDSKDISVLAVQQNNTFRAFVSESGGTINRLETGTYNGQEMVAHIVSENKMLKWILRGVGILLIFIGISAVLGPISTISSFVPIFGNLVGSIVSLVSFLLALSISLTVIAIAWFAFRPLLSIILLAGVIIIGYLLSKVIKKNKNKQINNQPQPGAGGGINIQPNTSNGSVNPAPQSTTLGGSVNPTSQNTNQNNLK